MTPYLQLPLAVMGVLTVAALMGTLAHCLTYGFRFTSKVPGGLLAAMARPAPYATKSEMGSYMVHLWEDEHYQYVVINRFCIVVCLTSNPPYTQFVTIPRGTKGYATIVAAAKLVESLRDYADRKERESA
jgi:hypothetical protein